MIEVNHLVKRYGNHLAVDHLSFKVEEGQIYGFLGPNGAGKSTTMNIMTGYLGATEGEVIINGHNILEEPEAAKKSIGYLPEIPPLYMDMTVEEYLSFAAELKRIPKAERAAQIEKTAELTKLTDMMPRLIKNLSKGYKQRVGLAQAILGFPPVIILDEPTVGLDPKQIIEIRDLIKTLSKKHTVILSSHILQEVSAVCDHVMIISHGRLVASDTPQNLEKMMRQAGSIEMEIKGSADRILEMIAKVCGAAVNIISEESGIVRCSVEVGNENVSQDADIREKLFFAFADAKMPILTMKMSNVSLEEIFLELTSDNSESADDFDMADNLEEPDKLKEPENLEEPDNLKRADSLKTSDDLEVSDNLEPENDFDRAGNENGGDIEEVNEDESNL